MTNTCIAVMAPGDMGHGVGRALREHGHDVITCLAGRSERTRKLAAAGGLRDVADLTALVTQADMILSILPPDRAVQQARDMAAAMTAAGTTPAYVDCNAIAPSTAEQVRAAIEGAGASFIDCGIIGLKPGPDNLPHFYVSGDDTAPMQALDGCGIKVIPIGGGTRASGMKMVYAALTKGTWTLHAAILMTAERLGLYDDLIGEYEQSQQAALKAMAARLPRIPADSGRWIGEMEEIAKTFRDAGTPGNFHDGAAAVFRVIAETPWSSEMRETIDGSRTLEQSIREYVKHLDAAFPATKAAAQKDAADD
ncbi:MAG: DUF1932 domain-containing protein [Rhodospirillaceae bacterium]